MAFVGKYKLATSDNFDEFLRATGVGLVTRKMANAATPIQEIKQEGDEISIKTTTTFKTTDIKFKLGEKFDEQTADGRVVKTVVTQEGNKLIQSQSGEKETVLTREFNGDEMKMVLTVDDIVCTRIYKKIE